MLFPKIYADALGHSYFGEHDLPHTGINTRRLQLRPQQVVHWRSGTMQPGYAIDFRRSETPEFVAVMSGRMIVGVSNGETRHFSRGDMFLLQDVTGQGHTTRIVGNEPCTFLRLTLPIDFKYGARQCAYCRILLN